MRKTRVTNRQTDQLTQLKVLNRSKMRSENNFCFRRFFVCWKKQGQIHGYPSHVRMGSEREDPLGIWNGAVNSVGQLVDRLVVFC